MSRTELRIYDAPVLRFIPLGHVEHTKGFVQILLLKPSGLIKRELKEIFQQNDCSFDRENPT